MFVNLWNEKDFRGCVRDFIHSGVKPDLAERVYSSRLIGTVPDLVMHGGGNTSCKTSIQDIYGELVDILHVKGSGWDLATIEPEGMPGLRLNPLLELRKLSSLTDKDMTNILRLNLIDCSSPNPSVETLLHAFLPFKIVDHTHATPFLSLLNLPEAEKFILEIFEGKLGVVPYVMPGFELAKLASEVYESNKEVEGLALLKHSTDAKATS